MRSFSVEPKTTEDPTSSASEITHRSRYLRGHRLTSAELKVRDLRVRGEHRSFGTVEGEIVDLSLYGLASVVRNAADRSAFILPGDRLEEVTVSHASGEVYRGSAAIRRVTEADGDLILGLELEVSGIDLRELYRESHRGKFSERWEALHQRAEPLPMLPEFKAWASDLRSYMTSVLEFLTEEEQQLKQEDLITREEATLHCITEAAPALVGRIDEAEAQLALLLNQLPEEEVPAYRAYAKQALYPLFAHSDFIRRAHDKPLGYAGDYEMMNMIYRQQPEGTTLFGKVLNLYSVRAPVAKAVLNRLDYISKLIHDAVGRCGRDRARIASIGCGPANELKVLLESSPELGRRLDVALIDQDDRSIAYCERSLAPLVQRTGLRCHFIRESVRSLLTAKELPQTLGSRDLIYSAGLFDYFADRSFRVLFQVLYGALANGGALVVGNVSDTNPSRHMMEFLCDWFLIGRSPDKLRSLAADLKPTASSVDVNAEPLGINLFLTAHR